MQRNEDILSITAQDAKYEFNARTGQISAIVLGGAPVVSGTNLVVWRRSTYCERNQLDRRKVLHNWDVFLQHMTATASRFEVSEAADGWKVQSTVCYREDEQNAVEVDFTYSIASSGVVRIDYTVKPQIEIDWLPEIGIALHTAGSVRALTWVGWGPLDSLLNRHASSLFGQWSAKVGSPEAKGTKAAPERVRIELAEGKSLHVSGSAGFRMEPEEGGEQTLRILSHVAGAWVKGGPPERPEWRIDLAKNRVFTSSLVLTPETAAKGEAASK
jgi:hypothetical protein